MKHYFSSLNEREKWIVVVGGICLFFYLYYVLLYSPLSASALQKRQQLLEKSTTLQWIQKIQSQGLKPKHQQVIDKSKLLTLVANQLRDNTNLHFPYHLEQTSTGDIQLSFNAVPFQQFLAWLAKLNEHYDIQTKQFDIERTDIPGVTRLMIVLSVV